MESVCALQQASHTQRHSLSSAADGIFFPDSDLSRYLGNNLTTQIEPLQAVTAASQYAVHSGID
jgi:hypothetical protein